MLQTAFKSCGPRANKWRLAGEPEEKDDDIAGQKVSAVEADEHRTTLTVL